MISDFTINKRSGLSTSCVLLLLAVISVAIGCATQTNSITTYAFLEDLGVSPNSRYVVVWTDFNQGTTYNPDGGCMNFGCRLYARAYDRTGTPVTGQILVSPTTNGKYTSIEAAIDDSGFFVVVYDQFIYNSSNSSLSNKLYFQRYSPTGTPLGAPQFIDYGERPDLVMTANGDIYVAYSNYSGFLNNNENVYVMKFNAAGVQVLPRILIDTASSSSATVRALCTGEFIVAYQAGPSTLSNSTYIRRYQANGATNGVRILVNATPAPSYIPETLIYKPNGHFAIIITQPGSSNTFDYYIKRYDASGNPSAPPELLFNGTKWRDVSTMSANTCGNYAFAYNPDGSADVMVREYLADDTPVPPYAINQQTSLMVGPLIGVASLSYVAAWERLTGTSGTQRLRDTFHVRRPLVASFPQPSATRVCHVSCNDCPKTRVIGRPAVIGNVYSWSPPTYLNNANVAQPLVTHPGGATPFSITYTVTITVGCCQRTESVTVRFEPKCPT